MTVADGVRDDAVLLKGGHLRGDPVDVRVDGIDVHRFPQRRLHEVNTHGSGCMLSAAIAAGLALGQPLVDACAAALSFVHRALARPHVLSNRILLAGVEHA